MSIFELQYKNKNKNYETLTGRHPTLKQRYEISALFARNISQKEWFVTAIALQVGVSESTISNEKKRNQNADGLYDADAANNLVLHL